MESITPQTPGRRRVTSSSVVRICSRATVPSSCSQPLRAVTWMVSNGTVVRHSMASTAAVASSASLDRFVLGRFTHAVGRLDWPFFSNSAGGFILYFCFCSRRCSLNPCGSHTRQPFSVRVKTISRVRHPCSRPALNGCAELQICQEFN